MVPVGLVKDFKPLGHSGHDKLQAVVGSTDSETGNPQTIGRFTILLKKKLENIFDAFHNLFKVSFDKKLTISLVFSFSIRL
jgi:hypothetical protein